MKFYEIFEPYYALMKAIDEVDATYAYIEYVAGSDGEFEEIKGSMKPVEKDYVIDKLKQAIDDDTGEVLTPEEIQRSINEEITEVLLVDSASS